MIQFKGKTIELVKSRDLSPKQMRKVIAMEPEVRTQYFKSLLGLEKESVRGVNSKAKGADSLAEKGKNSVLHRFNYLLQNDSEANHTPIFRGPNSKWCGVEIECLFEGEDNRCDSCDGSGETSCYNCEGEGNLRLEDHNGHTYRVDCAVCDGSGREECSECDGNSDSSGIFEKIRRKLRNEKITHCSVKEDGSLSGEGKIGVEVTVLFDASHGFSKIERVCKILNGLGASVNTTCGLHVHLDHAKQSEDEAMEAGRRFASYLPILSKLVPESRRKNTYCQLRMNTIDSDCRYYAVNMAAFERHGTIEIRLHSGTTDAEKISNWVRLLLAIDSLQFTPGKISTFQGLIDSLKLGPSMTEYFDKRFTKFNESESEARVISDDETEGVEDQSLEDVLEESESIQTIEQGA